MNVQIKILQISECDLDVEYLPLCPYCDQPIMGDAVIVQHDQGGILALAHNDCTNEENDEDLERILELEDETTPLAPGAKDI